MMAGQLLGAIGGDLPVKVLAVVGGAVLGALVTGGVVGLAVKALFGRKLPRYPAWGMRGLGAVLFGWLVALWVFGGGGGGIGGVGGWGIGSGTGRGDSTARTPTTGQAVSPTASATAPSERPAAAETLRIEVLGPAALKKLTAQFADPGDRGRLAALLDSGGLDQSPTALGHLLRTGCDGKPGMAVGSATLR